MSVIQQYHSHITRILQDVFEQEAESMEQAARLIADANEEGRSIFGFGCNHAGLITLELFYRTGGMVTVNPIRAPGMMLELSPPTMTSEMEKKFVSPRLLERVKWNGKNCFTLSTGKKMIFFSSSSDRQLIRELEIELKDLPRRKAQETARLSGVSADLQAAKTNQELANQRVKGFEEDAKALREKIQQLKTTQMGLKSNKEYQQYSIQIDLVSHDLETTENSQLAAMDELPSAEARIADAQAKFDQEAGGVKAFCDEIDERIAAVTAELAEAQKERAEKAKLVTDPRFMLYYERLRTKRWPVVVTLTHDGVCDGCHLVQPPSVAQLVDHNSDLVACTMCGRVLYRD